AEARARSCRDRSCTTAGGPRAPVLRPRGHGSASPLTQSLFGCVFKGCLATAPTQDSLYAGRTLCIGIDIGEVCMPEKRTIARASRDARQGKAATTQAGEFIREEIHHVRE